MAYYRSPYPDRSLPIALLSGHSIEITPEGRDVPDMFVSHVIAAGGIASKAPKKKVEKTEAPETGLTPGEDPEPEPEPEQAVTDVPVNPTGAPSPEPTAGDDAR